MLVAVGGRGSGVNVGRGVEPGSVGIDVALGVDVRIGTAPAGKVTVGIDVVPGADVGVEVALAPGMVVAVVKKKTPPGVDGVISSVTSGKGLTVA